MKMKWLNENLWMIIPAILMMVAFVAIGNGDSENARADVERLNEIRAFHDRLRESHERYTSEFRFEEIDIDQYFNLTQDLFYLSEMQQIKTMISLDELHRSEEDSQ